MHLSMDIYDKNRQLRIREFPIGGADEYVVSNFSWLKIRF